MTPEKPRGILHVMPNKGPLPTMHILDRDGNRLDATWSKSMKSLIVTVGPPDPSGREWRQVSLDPDQAAQLQEFIAQTHPG